MIDWPTLIGKLNGCQSPNRLVDSHRETQQMPESERYQVPVDVQKLPSALHRVLDIVSEFWTVQGFLGGVEFDNRSHELRTNPGLTGDNPLKHNLTAEDVVALCACKQEGWVSTVGNPDEGGVVNFTIRGIEEVFKRCRHSPQNTLVCLVDHALKARQKIEPHVQNADKLQEEIDRIEQDLSREIQHQDVNSIYHKIAESLHLLLMSDASQHLTKAELRRRRSQRKRVHITLAELYFGDSPIFGGSGGLLKDPRDFWRWKMARKVSPDLSWETMDLQSTVSVLNHNLKRFNPRLGPLLTRDEWLAQRLAFGGGYRNNPGEAFYAVGDVLESIRDTISAHSLPTEERRQKLERLQWAVIVNGETHLIAHMVLRMGVYIQRLLMAFRLCPYYPPTGTMAR